MGKLTVFNMISLDGFIAGANGEIDWHHVDEEFNQFAIEQLDTIDGLLFGRVTYELMASYWPHATEDDPVVAEKMNAMPKYVFSRTLGQADWSNSHLVRGDALEEVKRLKQMSNGNLFLFGSADLASTFIRNRLIDEFRLMVNPVVLEKGIPMFKDLDGRINLKLKDTRVFGNGNILLYYQPERD